jgi:hypothetical protein
VISSELTSMGLATAIFLLVLFSWLQALGVNSLAQLDSRNIETTLSSWEQDTTESSSLELQRNSFSQDVNSYRLDSRNSERDSSNLLGEDSSIVEQDSSSLEQDIRDQIVADLGLGRLPDIARVSVLC